MGRIQLLLLNFTIISTLDASLGIILFTRRLTLDKPTFCKRHVIVSLLPSNGKAARRSALKVGKERKKREKGEARIVFPRKSH